MAYQPHRPFESLEWYRDAARRNFRGDEPAGFAGWARGGGMLHAHVCVYAASIVVLLVINLLRSPDAIWAEKWIMAWTVLLLIHVVAAGILWAIAQWDTDSPGDPLEMPPGTRWQAPAGWAGPGDERLAQDVEFRASTPAGALSGPAVPWAGWNADDGQADSPADRVSWKDASAVAWLERGAHEVTAPKEPPRGDNSRE